MGFQRELLMVSTLILCTLLILVFYIYFYDTRPFDLSVNKLNSQISQTHECISRLISWILPFILQQLL